MKFFTVMFRGRPHFVEIKSNGEINTRYCVPEALGLDIQSLNDIPWDIIIDRFHYWDIHDFKEQVKDEFYEEFMKVCGNYYAKC